MSVQKISDFENISDLLTYCLVNDFKFIMFLKKKQ